MTWHEHYSRYRRRGRRPPPFVRRMGCAFAAMIALAAIGATTLVSMLFRSPQRALAIIVTAVVIGGALVGAFSFAIRNAARAFGEQDRLRRQLMADVAHELRTPLAILQGRVEGLLDGIYPRDDARLEELLAETRHLTRLVEDLRTLANAEAGALELRKEHTDVAQLIRDAASSIGRPVELSIGELPVMELDPLRIREVLLNLLSNADRHTPAGGSIAIHAAIRGRQLVIEVRDSGGGIAAEELPHVFERFQKSRDSRGSGLGLAIARNLVLAHGGDIRLDSILGQGTNVVVTIPVE